MPGVPILMYHEVSPRPSGNFRKYTVSPQTFAAQMRYLAAAGYVPVGLDAVLASRSGAPLRGRAVVLTFDDGFRDCLTYVVPTLVRLGFTSTFYLVAGLIGRTSRWTQRTRGMELPLADWPAVRDMQAAGMTCGAHTMTHPRLAELPAADCREELRRSRELLEDQLGCAVEHLAYPFGSYSDSTRAIAAETGYRSACSVREGLSGSDDDPLALHRVPVTGFDTLLDFATRLRTARTPRELVGRAVRRVLRRLTTSGSR
jgi:peptidoglycan/xylan/chitin deacetylase (PgdA/CDA1 family)